MPRRKLQTSMPTQVSACTASLGREVADLKTPDDRHSQQVSRVKAWRSSPPSIGRCWYKYLTSRSLERSGFLWSSPALIAVYKCSKLRTVSGDILGQRQPQGGALQVVYNKRLVRCIGHLSNLEIGQMYSLFPGQVSNPITGHSSRLLLDRCPILGHEQGDSCTYAERPASGCRPLHRPAWLFYLWRARCSA
jgi:hypothetical protein